MIKLGLIIRSVGERTEEVCTKLLEHQSKNQEIKVVREHPHANAIRKTLLTGIDCDAEWVVAIDADVILLPGALEAIRRRLHHCSKEVFHIHFSVYDKLYSMHRWAGIHVYRKSSLAELLDALENISQSPNLKIEAAIIKELMSRPGREALFIKDVVGLHDFEQFFKDIYRKVYLNVIRNPGNNKLARKNWRLRQSDDDYRVMLRAMDDALNERRDLVNSVNDFDEKELAEILQNLGLREKSTLSWDDFVTQELESSMLNKITRNRAGSFFTDYFESKGGLSVLFDFIKKK